MALNFPFQIFMAAENWTDEFFPDRIRGPHGSGQFPGALTEFASCSRCQTVCRS